MGADTFYVYFGVKYLISSDEESERLERREDPRQADARKAHLKVVVDRRTDGDPPFLLIGHEIGRFGVENASNAEIRDEEIRRVVDETRRKLVEAGFPEEPRFVFQLAADY